MTLETERGSTRWPSVEKTLWKRLWTCGKTDNSMNIIVGCQQFVEGNEATRRQYSA